MVTCLNTYAPLSAIRQTLSPTVRRRESVVYVIYLFLLRLPIVAVMPRLNESDISIQHFSSS